MADRLGGAGVAGSSLPSDLAPFFGASRHSMLGWTRVLYITSAPPPPPRSHFGSSQLACPERAFAAIMAVRLWLEAEPSLLCSRNSVW